MKNCVRTYGDKLTHGHARLWSVRKDGARVATLQLGGSKGQPLVTIHEMKAPRNREAPPEVWQAAGRWHRQHELFFIGDRARSNIPPDRKMWFELWKPYWLAKKGLPDWLPIRPARWALRAL